GSGARAAYLLEGASWQGSAAGASSEDASLARLDHPHPRLAAAAPPRRLNARRRVLAASARQRLPPWAPRRLARAGAAGRASGMVCLPARAPAQREAAAQVLKRPSSLLR